MIVLSDAVPGRTDDYNRWYDEDHLADVVALRGVSAARRYELVDAQLPAEITPVSEHRYLAIYELDGAPDDVIGALNDGLATGAVPLSDALDTANVRAWIFSSRGEGVRKSPEVDG